MVLKREIKNRTTTLSVSDDRKVNRNGYEGISRYRTGYRVDMECNGHKYLIGTFHDLHYAITARKIAEEKRAAGKLEEWIASKPHGNSADYEAFWKNEFERMEHHENS